MIVEKIEITKSMTVSLDNDEIKIIMECLRSGITLNRLTTSEDVKAQSMMASLRSITL